MDSVNPNNPDLWKALGAIFGPGGIALLLALGGVTLFQPSTVESPKGERRRMSEGKGPGRSSVSEVEGRESGRCEGSFWTGRGADEAGHSACGEIDLVEDARKLMRSAYAEFDGLCKRILNHNA